MSVQGTAADGFGPVTDLLDSNLREGVDVGASLCVVRDGEIVVDLWGGVADVESGRPWERDTIVHTWSITKAMTTVVLLRLADQGLVDLDAPIANHWPEFGAAGKQHITLTHVLSHTSGVAGWQDPIDVDTLCDVDEAAARLAAQAPWWAPGAGSGYATIAFGHLIGEVVRRVTGRRLGEVLADEVTGPVGADYLLGVPAADDQRVATLVPPPPSGFDISTLDPDSPMVKTMVNPYVPVPQTGSVQWRRAELGGVNGHGNARSIAQVQAALSHGGVAVGGQRLLSAAMVDEVYVERSHTTDRVLGVPIRFGLGLGLSAADAPGYLPDGKVSWWAGWGGAIVVNDADRHVTMAYAMNRMTAELVGPARTADYVCTVWDCVG